MAVYYNSLMGSGSKSFATSPLDVCIEIAQNDQKLFNAVLESDFLEIYAENGTIYVTEEEKEQTKEEVKDNIFTKAKNAIVKFIESVKKFFADLWRKITELFDADKRLVNKYAKYLSDANISGYKIGIEETGNGIEDAAAKVEGLKGKISSIISAGTITGDEVTEEELNNIVKLDEYVKKLDESKVDDALTKKIVEFYKSGKYNAIKSKTDQVQQFEIASLNELLGKMKNNSSSDNNDQYKKASAMIKLISNFNARYSKMLINYLKLYRGEFSKIGAYAINKSGEKKSENTEETKNEAALTDIYLDLVNEMAIEEIFSLA